MYQELNELVAEYTLLKCDRPLEEQSLFTLVGREGAQTTEQRLQVGAVKSKPTLRSFLRDVEESAPVGLNNVVSQVRALVRPVHAGMTPHRDSINLSLDRVVLTKLAGPSEKPPEFPVKLMSGPDATPARGPYGHELICIPKENGRLMVKGPNARGEKVRVVHGVTGGDVTSLTLVVDYCTFRTGGLPATNEDRDSARRSVVTHTSRAAADGVAINPFADTLVLSHTVPRSTGSRRGTESNNAMVLDTTTGELVKSASLKGEGPTVPPPSFLTCYIHQSSFPLFDATKACNLLV